MLKKFDEFLNEGNRNNERPEKGEGYRVWNNNEPLRAAIDDKKNAVFFYSSDNMVCNIFAYDDMDELKDALRYKPENEKEEKDLKELLKRLETLNVGFSIDQKTSANDYIVFTKIKGEKKSNPEAGKEHQEEE